MHIAILGLGYVGATTAACLTRAGHHVYGVDISAEKVRAIAEGRSPVVEPGVEELLQAGVRDGRLQAGPTLEPWIDTLDLAVICVGTPSRADGKLDLSHLLTVARDIGRCVHARRAGLPPLLLVFRSTVPPGTTERLVVPTLARAAGEGPGRLYEVAFNPEFLREATAIKDYFAPPKIVIGEREPGVTGRLRGMYEGIDAPLFEVPFAVAEMVKFADNSWHAVKVAFANEVGRVALARGVDPQAVADVFLADTKLNVSPVYLRPGGPFGGSCLPKDLSGMLSLAREAGLSAPLLAGAKESNAVHLAWIFQEVRRALPPPGPVLLVGLSFKAGTDDLRQQPEPGAGRAAARGRVRPARARPGPRPGAADRRELRAGARAPGGAAGALRRRPRLRGGEGPAVRPWQDRAGRARPAAAGAGRARPDAARGLTGATLARKRAGGLRTARRREPTGRGPTAASTAAGTRRWRSGSCPCRRACGPSSGPRCRSSIRKRSGSCRVSGW